MQRPDDNPPQAPDPGEPASTSLPPATARSWQPEALPSSPPTSTSDVSAQTVVVEAGENPPWNGWDVVLFAVASIISLFVALFIVSIVLAATQGINAAKAQQLDSDLRLVLPIQLFSYVVMVTAMYATVRVRYGRPFLDAIAWNWSRIRVAAFVAAGIGLAILAQLSEVVLRMPKDLPIQKAFSTTTGAYLIGIFGVLIAPFVEELFFRGFLYPVAARSLRSAGQTALALALLCAVIGVASKSAREHMLYVAVAVGIVGGVLMQANSGVGDLAQTTRFRIQSVSAVAITGVAFALVHAAQLGYSWTPLLVMFVVGASLTAIRAVSRSVAASTVAHMTYNFVLMATLWVATGHFRHLERISR